MLHLINPSTQYIRLLAACAHFTFLDPFIMGFNQLSSRYSSEKCCSDQSESVSALFCRPLLVQRRKTSLLYQKGSVSNIYHKGGINLDDQLQKTNYLSLSLSPIKALTYWHLLFYNHIHFLVKLMAVYLGHLLKLSIFIVPLNQKREWNWQNYIIYKKDNKYRVL